MDAAELTKERALHVLFSMRVDARFCDAVSSLNEASVLLLCCFDDRYDPLVCVRSASDVLSQLATVLESSEEMLRLLGLLGELERSLALLGFRAPPPRPLLIATHGRLALHHLNREVICPWVSTEESEFFAPLQVQPRAGFAGDPLPAFTNAGWAKMRLEDIFQDICALAASRTPQMAEPWRSAAVMEARLLSLIDAALSLSGVSLSYLEGVVLSSPAPSPQQLLGLSLLGGVLSGRDGLAMSERVYLEMEAEEGFAEALVEGWSLLPHGLVEPILRIWLESEHVGRRTVAVQVLARRKTIQVSELETTLRGLDEVTAAALVPYVLLGGPHHRYAIDECLMMTDSGAGARLLRSVRLASALSRHPEAVRRCSAQCVEGDIEAGRLYAALGGAEDARRMLDHCQRAPNEAAVVALGWAGDPACIPLLIALLTLKEQGVVFQAAAALERITGAGLLDWVPLSPEAVMDAEPGRKADAEPLREALKDPRDPEPEASPELIELPSCDPERWRKYVTLHQERLVPGVKTRRGHPFTPLVSLWELDQGSYSPTDRRALYHELVIRSGLNLVFDERAFVVDQEEQIAEIRQRLASRGWEPGSWELPLNSR